MPLGMMLGIRFLDVFEKDRDLTARKRSGVMSLDRSKSYGQRNNAKKILKEGEFL